MGKMIYIGGKKMKGGGRVKKYFDGKISKGEGDPVESKLQPQINL